MLVLLMDANDDHDNQQQSPSHLALVCGAQHTATTQAPAPRPRSALTADGAAGGSELMVRDGN